MAGVFQCMSIVTLPPPRLTCTQRWRSSACSSPLSALSAPCAVRKVHRCALGKRSTGFPRARSGNLLLGQKLRIRRIPPGLRPLQRIQVSAEGTDFIRVLGVVVKTGRDALEAGSQLVPAFVPRPLAQAGVALASLVVFSLVLKSVFSTAIFIAAVGGICYAALVYMSRDGSTSSSSGGAARGGTNGGTNGTPRRSDADAVEEARRIMEKYK